MSMMEHPVHLFGLFIDNRLAAEMLLAHDRAKGTVPEEIQEALDDETFWTLADRGMLPGNSYDIENVESLLGNDVNWASDFTGDIRTIFPHMTSTPINTTVDGDMIYYIVAEREPDLFKPAYSSMQEFYEEFVKKLTAHDITLPDGFNLWTYLVEVTGTTFC